MAIIVMDSKSKGMTMSINVIITIVVVLVVAMFLIMLVSGNLSKFGASSENTNKKSAGDIQCQVELASGCQGLKSGVDTCPADKCPSCPTSTKCP